MPITRPVVKSTVYAHQAASDVWVSLQFSDSVVASLLFADDVVFLALKYMILFDIV